MPKPKIQVRCTACEKRVRAFLYECGKCGLVVHKVCIRWHRCKVGRSDEARYFSPVSVTKLREEMERAKT